MNPGFTPRSFCAAATVLALVGSVPHNVGAQVELLPAVAISDVSLIGQTWPGRFNADGITDLVGRDPETGDIVVLVGRGDGTFADRVRSATKASPVAVRDLNRDGLQDVVAIDAADSRLHVLKGNGNGTFAIATSFPAGFYTFALVEDFDEDGHRDLAIGEEGFSLHLFRGLGNFSFAPPITYETGAWPHGATVADFNQDARLDIAVASRYGWTVDLFLNNGGLLFGTAVIEIGRSATDVTARDLNGDGKTDLIVAARRFNDDPAWDPDGAVHVFAGRGDGTFAPPAIYPTVPGTFSVVVGDFTRDGKPDIATVNRSANFLDDNCSGFKNVDSVSILPGNADGTFGPHTSFALSSQLDIWKNEGLHNMVTSLNTNDLNGDGHTDLIASDGIVLLNQAPRANRLPVAHAGADQRSLFREFPLRGGGEDPDGHFLTFSWNHNGGFPVPPVPFYCYPDLNPGDNVFTLTVDDGQGGRASDSMTFTLISENADPSVQVTAPLEGAVLQVGQPYEILWTSSDSDGVIVETWVEYADDGATFSRISECDGTNQVRCTWSGPRRATEFGRIRVVVRDDLEGAASATSGRFSARAGSSSNELPIGWFSEDIGAVGAVGRASYTTGVYTVAGSGADVWGTADELRFAYTRIDGDFDFIARVASVQNLDKWVKAGLMAREHTGAGARHAFAIATPRTERGLAFQRRPTEGGTSLHTAGPAIAPSIILSMRRRGDTIETFYRQTEAHLWTTLGRQTFSGLAQTLLVGFGVSSHIDGTLATAKFDHVSLVPLLGPGSPAGWFSVDVGGVATAGRTSYSSPGLWTVTGSGADVWGTADEMQYAFVQPQGDFDISARVSQVQNLDKWVKAGLMIRETLNAGSRHAFAIATPRTERGIVFQRRPTTDGLTLNTAGPLWSPPHWLKLSRRGDVITAYYRRAMTDPWVQYGTQTYSGLPSVLLAGFAVSSHIDGTNASGTFDFLSIDFVK